jgi:hypothetical protein
VAREQRFVQLGFTRPVRDEFVATLELSVREVSDSQPADSLGEFARGFAKELAEGVAKEAARKVTRGRWPVRPPLRVFGYAGLECLPATHVLRALSGSAEERVRIGAWSLCPAKARTRETFGWVELKPDDEWRAKLAVLVKNMDQRAGALAKEYATPARFVDELRERTEQNIEGLLAALIGYDHTGDARELINQYEENATLPRQRCFRQALRVLDAEVSLETLEQAVGEPLPARFEIDWSALRRVGSNSRNAKRHSKEILSAVRDSHAITREERRSLLKAELSSRGIYVPPVRREMLLDELETGYVQSQVGSVSGIREAVRVGLAGARSAQAAGDAPDPPWLTRPAAACYKLRRNGAEACVELDPTSQPFLDDVFSNLSLRVESQKLNQSSGETELWFAHSSEDPAVIVASIGEQRVGLVEVDAQAALIEALAPADARGELAWTEAWLYRRANDPRYVLQFKVPGWQPGAKDH